MHTLYIMREVLTSSTYLCTSLFEKVKWIQIQYITPYSPSLQPAGFLLHTLENIMFMPSKHVIFLAPPCLCFLFLPTHVCTRLFRKYAKNNQTSYSLVPIYKTCYSHNFLVILIRFINFGRNRYTYCIIFVTSVSNYFLTKYDFNETWKEHHATHRHSQQRTVEATTCY